MWRDSQWHKKKDIFDLWGDNIFPLQNDTHKAICRVFFLRHGETDNIDGIKSDEIPLNDIGKEQIEKAGILFQELWLTKENTIILYGEKSKRIIETKNILDGFNIWTFQNNCLLETTQKKLNSETWTIENINSHIEDNATQFQRIIALTHKEILKSFQEKDGKFNNHKNIILLGHKSSPWFHEIAKERPVPIILDSSRINTGEISEMDISKENKFIDYDKHKEILFISTKNIQDVVAILQNEPWLQKAIDNFRNKKTIIFELQNEVNEYFKNHPWLYKKYIVSNNLDLALFCTANLIKENEYTFLQNALPSLIKKSLTISQILALFSLFIDGDASFIGDETFKEEDPNHRHIELFLKIIITEKGTKEIVSELRKSCTEKHILNIIDYYEGLIENYNYNVLPQIEDIRNKSLDERFHAKNGKKIGNNFEISDEEVRGNCLNILLNWEQFSYIRWDGGSGKSFFSAYLQEKIRENYFTYQWKSIFPIFIQMRWKRLEEVVNDINKQCWHIKWIRTNIYCFFESLDESRCSNIEEIRKLLNLDYFTEYNAKAIISTRKGYLDRGIGWNRTRYSIAWMKNPMEYVSDYFEWDEKKVEKYKLLEGKIGEKYINENSLFVSILCELIRFQGDYIEKVNNKWDLFESITYERLSKREGEKRDENIDWEASLQEREEKRDQSTMDKIHALGTIAYEKNFKRLKITNRNIKEVMSNIWIHQNIQSLSFLFRSNEAGNYEFIHKSIESYFLLKKFKDSYNKIWRHVNEQYSPHETLELFLIATKEGYTDMIKTLLDATDRSDWKNQNCGIAFEWACSNGQKEIVELMIDKVVNLDGRYKLKKTIFISTCASWQKEIAQLLATRIKGIHKEDINGCDAFIHACANWEKEIAEWLIEQWADINRKDIRWRSAFMRACYRWHRGIVELLIDKIKNINELDNYGHTCLTLATDWKVRELITQKMEEVETKKKNTFPYNAKTAIINFFQKKKPQQADNL